MIKPVIWFSTFAFLTVLTSAVPLLSGAVIKWVPGGENFRDGLEEISLEHGETLAMQCNKTDHMSFYLVTHDEMEDCERSMSSRIVGTCGGRGGSTTVRQVMKTVSAGAHDLLWPTGTYYIIAIPGYQRRDVPDDYYCRILGMKLKVNVVASGTLPFNRQSITSQLAPAIMDSQAPAHKTFSFYSQEGPKIPSQFPVDKRPIAQPHYPTHLEAPRHVPGSFRQFARNPDYPVLHDSPFVSDGLYGRDDPRVTRGDPQYHRLMMKPQHPIPIHDWTLLDAREEYVKGSRATVVVSLFAVLCLILV